MSRSRSWSTGCLSRRRCPTAGSGARGRPTGAAPASARLSRAPERPTDRAHIYIEAPDPENHPPPGCRRNGRCDGVRFGALAESCLAAPGPISASRQGRQGVRGSSSALRPSDQPASRRSRRSRVPANASSSCALPGRSSSRAASHSVACWRSSLDHAATWHSRAAQRRLALWVVVISPPIGGGVSPLKYRVGR